MASGRRRILYVVNAFERDAPTSVTGAVASALVKEGHSVAMVAWSRGGPLQGELDKAGVVTDVLQGLRLIELIRWIRAFQPGIVHSILVRPTLGTLLARMFLPGRRFRWVAGDHGIHEWHERGRLTGWLMTWIMPTVLSVADGVVTVSQSAAAKLIGLGVSPVAVAVVPNGVDPRKFYPRSRAERCAVVADYFPDDDPWEVWPLMGTSGNLRAVKGTDILISAMPSILEKWPAARLIIWGDGPEKSKLDQLVQDNALAGKIKLAGRVDQIEKLLPLLDLYVQPSREESFGMAAAEAMCCGVPAVLSDAGGLPELSGNGKVAHLFSAGQSDDLARAALAALDDKRALQKEGAAGRGWILRNYTSTMMIRRMKEVYDRVSRDKEAGGK